MVFLRNNCVLFGFPDTKMTPHLLDDETHRQRVLAAHTLGQPGTAPASARGIAFLPTMPPVSGQMLQLDSRIPPLGVVRLIMKFCPLLFLLAACSHWVHSQGISPDWQLEGAAPWQARDSQAEWVFRDQLWIGGGWFQSFAEPPRDVWTTRDGKEWQLIEKNAPWLHSDLPMNITFADKMWIMGGWHKGRLPGHSASNQVWSSIDGSQWDQVTASAGWSPRLASGLVEFQGRLWLLGGTENYYFGTDKSLKNDVWSSADGRAWKLETAGAGWSPRAYHQAIVLHDKIYVFGGGNYTPAFHAKNDVWSSSDGVNWTCETESAPWEPRLWFSAVVYRGAMWVLGGWSKEKDNFDDVWHSADGKTWQQLETKTCWKARHEHSAFVFQDKLWLAGGHARPLSNEVWSLKLPGDWKPQRKGPIRN